MTVRDYYRQALCERIGVPVLSFRACRVLEQYQLFTVPEIAAWLRTNESEFAMGVGDTTRAELCAAVGVSHEPAPQSMQGKLNAALKRVAELERQLAALTGHAKPELPAGWEDADAWLDNLHQKEVQE